jgi:MtN3 and saliva related transmembrane protein
MAKIEVIGILATVAVSAGWVPQVVRGYRRKSLDDLSWIMMAIFAAGSILWLSYGYLILDFYVTLTNAIILSLIIILSLMKVNYHHRK